MLLLAVSCVLKGQLQLILIFTKDVLKFFVPPSFFGCRYLNIFEVQYRGRQASILSTFCKEILKVFLLIELANTSLLRSTRVFLYRYNSHKMNPWWIYQSQELFELVVIDNTMCAWCTPTVRVRITYRPKCFAFVCTRFFFIMESFFKTISQLEGICFLISEILFQTALSVEVFWF